MADNSARSRARIACRLREKSRHSGRRQMACCRKPWCCHYHCYFCCSFLCCAHCRRKFDPQKSSAGSTPRRVLKRATVAPVARDSHSRPTPSSSPGTAVVVASVGFRLSAGGSGGGGGDANGAYTTDTTSTTTAALWTPSAVGGSPERQRRQEPMWPKPEVETRPFLRIPSIQSQLSTSVTASPTVAPGGGGGGESQGPATNTHKSSISGSSLDRRLTPDFLRQTAAATDSSTSAVAVSHSTASVTVELDPMSTEAFSSGGEALGMRDPAIESRRLAGMPASPNLNASEDDDRKAVAVVVVALQDATSETSPATVENRARHAGRLSAVRVAKIAVRDSFASAATPSDTRRRGPASCADKSDAADEARMSQESHLNSRYDNEDVAQWSRQSSFARVDVAHAEALPASQSSPISTSTAATAAPARKRPSVDRLSHEAPPNRRSVSHRRVRDRRRGSVAVVVNDDGSSGGGGGGGESVVAVNSHRPLPSTAVNGRRPLPSMMAVRDRQTTNVDDDAVVGAWRRSTRASEPRIQTLSASSSDAERERDRDSGDGADGNVRTPSFLKRYPDTVVPGSPTFASSGRGDTPSPLAFFRLPGVASPSAPDVVVVVRAASSDGARHSFAATSGVVADAGTDGGAAGNAPTLPRLAAIRRQFSAAATSTPRPGAYAARDRNNDTSDAGRAKRVPPRPNSPPRPRSSWIVVDSDGGDGDGDDSGLEDDDYY